MSSDFWVKKSPKCRLYKYHQIGFEKNKKEKERLSFLSFFALLRLYRPTTRPANQPFVRSFVRSYALRRALTRRTGQRPSAEETDHDLPCHSHCDPASRMGPSESGQILESKGLVSIDRSEAAALLSTTPRLRPKSSTNDFAPLHCKGCVSFRHSDATFYVRR